MEATPEKWEKLGFENDFLFSKVMRNPEICKGFLEIVLEKEIEKINYPEAQKTFDQAYDVKSIRLDIYVRGENAIYDIEMQTTDNKNLPKRTRFYQSLMDFDLLEKGENYSKLKKSYIIFICLHDPFKKGNAKYTFKQTCQENYELLLGDETITIFLNVESNLEHQAISKDLRFLLQYIGTKNARNDFTKKIQRELIKAKQNKEWRQEYMKFNIREMDAKEEQLMLDKKMFKLYKRGLTYEQIAKECNIPIERVKEFFED